MVHRILTGILLCAVLVSLAGCTGSDRPDLVTVSGQVLIDGDPVADADLQVIPEGTRAARGQTDAQGNFTLTTFDEGDGCVPGTHPVTITAITYPNNTEEVLHVPEKYMDSEKTDVTITVDEPTEDLKIELTWGDQQGPITRKVEDEGDVE